MALSKTITQILNNVTVAASGNSSASDGVDLSQAVDFGIGYRMTFHASATQGARVDLFADPTGSSISFTIGTYDDPADSGDVAVDASRQVNGFIQMQRAPKFVRARVTNLDTGQSITGVSLWAHVQTP